ncbi:MAG: glutamine-hydrolyzing GMP synthase [Clostridiales bacterium]|jgi:GMP synthase (glutamine-hydrolysing)|nr:glutamine-hydrolyzing GMP synthase [Clostridiales bacterium]
MNHQTVIVLDFGGQYNQLIARRVRENNVYAEVMPYNTPLDVIMSKNPKGIIFTGGPNSVYDATTPKADPKIYECGVPILGLCYGMQLIAHQLGGEVESASVPEFGATMTDMFDSVLSKNVVSKTMCWMSHNDYVSKAPAGFSVIASTEATKIAGFANDARKIYALQFHPEVNHTPQGRQMLHNFLFDVCGCDGDWKMSSFAIDSVNALKAKIGDKKVLCAMSGGVDSSVAALMLHKAVGTQLTCVFVDHGCLRKNEGDEVRAAFEKFGLNLISVDAGEHFLSKLQGITEPEQKRKIIGEEFIRVFEKEAKKLGTVDFLAQGTIYPDVIESGQGDAAVIKSHHNVGGLPDVVDFKEIIEPLRDLFKDEVRAVGEELGLPHDLVWRQPFPGPGLAIRVIGDITPEKIDILQNADYIFREEVAIAGIAEDINQYFAVLTNTKSVGVMGDERTYDWTIALRAVTTDDFMTADWAKIPYDVLGRASNRIVNECAHVGRVVYDITTKPPATIEWE